MQTIALVGNGTYFDCHELLITYTIIIALDGGYTFCQKNHVMPTVTLGDGDSLMHKPNDFILNPDQMTTDVQKGLRFIADHYQEYQIDLFGFVSIDRLDHTLSAISLLSDPHIQSLYTPYQKISLIHDRTSLHRITNFSLIPTTPSAQVIINGAKWSGEYILDQSNSGLSNEATSTTVDITVTHGTVLCITPQVWTKL